MIINLNGQTILTSLVIVNGDIVTRAPLFNLEAGSIARGNRDAIMLDVNNVDVTLSDAAAGVLNQIFNVTGFSMMSMHLLLG